MARRAGKAASRKARQRNVPRQPRRPAVATTPAPETQDVPTAATGVKAAPTVVPAQRRPSSPAREAIGSQLTDRERAGYHYVEADLRDIGILTVAMTALLLIAWFVFSALGLAG